MMAVFERGGEVMIVQEKGVGEGVDEKKVMHPLYR
jgi:hypothetical protein